MKAFWLTGSIIFFVLILVIAFENIQAQCSYVNFLFYEVGTQVNPTFTFFGMAVIGMTAGIFFFGLVNSIFKKPTEEELESDNSTMS